MLPMAGLFLPETLHRSDRPVSSHTDTDSPRLKYFQRVSGQTKHEAKEAEVSSPATSSRTSTTDNAFPSITTAFHFADFVFTSSKASPDAQAFALLINHVRQDVSEASRLYLSPAVSHFLEAWPDKKSWIDAILLDVRRSLNDVGSYMETFRVAGDDGGAAGIKKRFEWISGHQRRLVTRQQLLSTCHQSLITTINIMQTVELCGVTNGTWQDPIFEAPVQPWVKNDSALGLRGPYSRREYRMSQKNLSMSSMHLPRGEEDIVETQSVNSLPAELPGSTPDDLANSSNTIVLTPGRYTSSSSRRLHFERTFRNATPEPPTDASTTASNKLPQTGQSYLIPQSKHLKTRRSFNQALLTQNATASVTRMSLDSARASNNARTSSAPSQPFRRSPTTPDLPRALHMLAEKFIERNDSTTSTMAVVSVPQLAKRCIPNPIYIRKHPDKHHSLPTELPHVQSQSSLTEDLADWMTFPRVQSERLCSTEWDVNSVVESSSMSVASCPVVTTMSTRDLEIQQESLEQEREINSETIVAKPDATKNDDKPDTQQTPVPTAQETSSQNFLEPERPSLASHERTASVQSMSSSITRKPLPPTAKVSTDIEITQSLTTVHDDEESLLQDTIEPVLTSSPATNPPNGGLDAELALLQQKMLSQTYIPDNDRKEQQPEKPSHINPLHVEETKSQPDTTPEPNDLAKMAEEPNQTHFKIEGGETLQAVPQPEQSSQTNPANDEEAKSQPATKSATIETAEMLEQSSEANIANNVNNAEQMEQTEAIPEPELMGVLPVPREEEEKISVTPPPVTVKPMTAQAKRRAAHQRRMEIAFGRT